MMQYYLQAIGVIMFLLMLLFLYRAAVGPTVIDRILAVNVVGTKTMLLLVLIGSLYRFHDAESGRIDMYVDLALTYALLNFLGSLAAAKYFRRHRDKGPEILKQGKIPQP